MREAVTEAAEDAAARGRRSGSGQGTGGGACGQAARGLQLRHRGQRAAVGRSPIIDGAGHEPGQFGVHVQPALGLHLLLGELDVPRFAPPKPTGEF